MTFLQGANEISTKRKTKYRFLFLLAKNKPWGARRPLTSIYPPTGNTKEIKDTEKWASTNPHTKIGWNNFFTLSLMYNLYG